MINELINRLQKLKQPDRDTDLDIAIACSLAGNGAETWGPYLRRTAKRKPYTASVDDVLMLIDHVLRPLHPHMTVTLKGSLSAPHDWFRAEITWPSHEMYANGYTLPLALCGVFMKAWRDSHEDVAAAVQVSARKKGAKA